MKLKCNNQFSIIFKKFEKISNIFLTISNIKIINRQLKWIMHDADQEIAPDAEEKLPSLTAENRATWAAIRRDFFSSGFNYASLSAIESAMFVVSLEHEEIGLFLSDFIKLKKKVILLIMNTLL